MDWVNKAVEQINDLFRSMTPGARITSALLLVVTVVSLGFLFRTQTTSPDSYLFGAQAFSTNDLAAMEGAFSKAGLNDYEFDGNKVRVPRGKRHQYVAALVDGKALPGDLHRWMEKAVSESTAFSSSEDRRLRVKLAVEREMADTISEMKDIESARVRYDEVVLPGLKREKLATASVSVKSVGSQPLEPDRIESIRDLVASSIATLKPENVAVTDLNTGLTSLGRGADGMPSPGRDPYIESKRAHEQQWIRKIERQLSFVPEAIVAVNVELNSEMISETTESKLDPKPVTVFNKEDSITQSTTANGPGGRPGAVPNTAVTNQSMAVSQTGGSESTTEEIRGVTQSLVSRTDSRTVKAPLVPERVHVTVSVPSDYYAKVWKQQNPAEEGAEPTEPTAADVSNIRTDAEKKIKATVAGLLPVPKDMDAEANVTVQTFERLAVEPVPPPSATQKATSWLGAHWGTLGMVLVGLVGLMMLRSMVRQTPPETPQQQPELRVVGDEPEEEPEQSDESKPRRTFATGGPNLREELAEVVRSDPDTAAAILKSWISEAS